MASARAASAKAKPVTQPVSAATSSAPSLRVLWLPCAFIVALFVLSFLPRIADTEILRWSFRVSTLVLATWLAVLFWRVRTSAGGRATEIVVRKQHYIQAAVQGSVYLYWGYHWRQVYDYAPLLLGQLLFAYAFDMLLAWSRREKYTLGFGAFPIVFSTNLFLWFKDDWFYLQFLLIAVGFLGKEFVRWQRDGKSTHIFNPSAFTLALFSLVLITTGTTSYTWGPEIASTLTLAPHIYLYLFTVGLIVMYFFSITLIAGTAAAVLFGSSALYFAVTGTPYFLDSEIPAAVFLGLHLLVTDPSTSPRTPLGKMIFGALYGFGVFGLYALLTAISVPTFYDKLLCVPLLNLSVQWIDRVAHSIERTAFANRVSGAWPTIGANLSHMAVWAAFFLTMSLMGRADGRHVGDSLPFWQQACADGRTHACTRLLQLETTYCLDKSAWACNELGGHYAEGRIVAADAERSRMLFARACELRFQPACSNLLHQASIQHASPHVLDLRLLLREGGKNLMKMSEPDLYARACEHGWSFACGHVASTR
jgi:hypothetical protein